MLKENLRIVLTGLKEYRRVNGYMPTHRELAGALGYESHHSVSKALRQLNELGYIIMTPKISRAIVITAKGKRHGKVAKNAD